MRFDLLLFFLLLVVAAIVDAVEYGNYVLTVILVVLSLFAALIVAIYKYLILDTFDDF